MRAAILGSALPKIPSKKEPRLSSSPAASSRSSRVIPWRSMSLTAALAAEVASSEVAPASTVLARSASTRRMMSSLSGTGLLRFGTGALHDLGTAANAIHHPLAIPLICSAVLAPAEAQATLGFDLTADSTHPRPGHQDTSSISKSRPLRVRKDL